MHSPRLSGAAIRAVARVARTRAGALALYRALRADLRLPDLEALPESARGDVPLDTRPLAGQPPRKLSDERLGAPVPQGLWPMTGARYREAYARGARTPLDVVERCLRAAEELASRTPSMGPLNGTTAATARREAEESTARLREGRARGPLDGLPFAVKEQTAVAGLPRRAGTSYLPETNEREDATVVARLRAAGAIVVGQTPMTELGMSPIGQNAQRKLPKNPHDPRRVAGGSSTGSGVAVATGLVPFAIGADGGGSIRIPSAMNGVFGIKPTWGRVSRAGDFSTGSVAHVGPLAASTADLADVLEAIGQRDPKDDQTSFAPDLAPGELTRALGRGVKGLRVGVDAGEWRDASPSVQRAGEEAIRALEQAGAVIVAIDVPLLRAAPAVGYLTIGPETRAAIRADWEAHADTMSADLQIAMSALGEVATTDYIDGQRLRSGLRREVARAFGDVDLFALPSTVDTAATASDAEMQSGFLDARLLASLCRFMFLGNLTGLPAASVPVGLDGEGLPIGFQLLGDAWDEATVLAAAAHLERLGVARASRPQVAVDLLP